MIERTPTNVLALNSRRRRAQAEPLLSGAASSLPELGTRLALFYLFIEYARPQFYLPLLNYAYLGVIASCLGGFYLLFAKRNPIPPVGWAMLVFILIQAKTIPFAPNQKLALFGTRDLLLMLAAGPLVIMTAVDTATRLRRVVGLYAVLGIVQAVQSLRTGGHGVGGFFWDENDLSLLLSTVTPIAYFYGANATNKTRKVVAYTGFALCTLGIITSFSRGGFLALAAVGLYVVVRSRRRLVTIVTILLALLVLLPFVPEGYYREMQTIETADEQGDTGEARLYMWGVAWKVFLHHPVMGVGTLNYPRVAQEFEDPSRGRHLWGFACHSTYFTLFAESGIPGTIAWGAIAWLAFASTRRTARLAKQRLRSPELESSSRERAQILFGLARGVEGGMIGFLVSGVFLTVNYYPVFWTLTAFAASTGVVAQREFADLAPPGARPSR